MAVRVLQVVTIMDRGGAETMIMNYYRRMDRAKVQFDFLVHREQRGIYEEEIEQLGGRIYRAFPIRPWNYGKYRRWLKAFFREHNEFAAVHAHILENCGFVLAAAKEAGIDKRIAHSHLSQPVLDYKLLFRKYGKYILEKCEATRNLACGKDAGKYLFDDRDFIVLPNAIDTSQFTFDERVRECKRQELGVSNRLVLGNVARFHVVKNQAFLIDILFELRKKRPDAVMLLVGEGSEQENVRSRAKQFGLEDSVWFMNVRTDVNELLQAMDVFVFPSKVEGLPLSLIEAQGAGLPCVLSDQVARETDITGLVEFVSLDAPPQYWAERILEAGTKKREDVSALIKTANYDIQDNAAWLQRYYLGHEEA